jgi:hypothetical protein
LAVSSSKKYFVELKVKIQRIMEIFLKHFAEFVISDSELTNSFVDKMQRSVIKFINSSKLSVDYLRIGSQYDPMLDILTPLFVSMNLNSLVQFQFVDQKINKIDQIPPIVYLDLVRYKSASVP